ncbi:tetratricopeptide repeat protein [Sphingomonas sp. Leaf30]|uniref:tetratricopeptide repeat protein n=1 Tax=Sphingomonas sp. Leaf30 TaxID=1736213 RepID=UPI0006F6C5CA|nr:tetratricopeptide repeat protein [Sphingomonas sp. Leaf30]KQN22292.1 hypothetical protein ASE89_05140 [Sphingomonas sp. Leaf30]
MEAPTIPICKHALLAIGLLTDPTAALADTGGLSAYLKARAADADGRVMIAADQYARALAAAPDDPVIAIRAYGEAIEAGDMPLVARAAGVLAKAGVAPADAALFLLAAAARKGDTRATRTAIATLGKGPLVVLAPSLNAWVARAEHRDPGAALATAGEDPVARRFAAETRKRIAAAPARQPLGLAVAQTLAGLAGDLIAGAPSPLAIALAQAAVEADPDYAPARIVLADALAHSDRVDRALAVLDRVDGTSPSAEAAIAKRLEILSVAGRDEAALAIARTRAERQEAVAGDWQRYADLLLTTGDAAAAAQWYGRVLAADHGAPAGARGGWGAWLQYGGALDQAGRWPEARIALRKAVALAPTQPLALNYLGFAQVEHGDDIAGSIRLLERASRLDPANPSVTDSLGWAYHRAGDTRRALPLLERAAQAEPTNAEIGDHLGDAYWSMGRRYEARYAWQAAIVTGDAEERARIAAKIDTGLPIAARR